MDPVATVSRVLLVVGLLGSLAALVALARPGGRWGLALRRRFVLGVPWGTLLTVALVAGFYLVVQGGFENWYRPVVVPFRAWSYFYPLGVVTAGVAHSGAGHLLGNLFGALVFGTLAEYAWGHFPTRRGSGTFTSLSTNPFARILAVPAVALAVSVTTGLFALGPVIGFSGVVFAYAGFALVRYPVAAVVLLAAGDLVDLVYRSLLTPVVSASGSVGYSVPWWSTVAIQGHALGVFTGFVVAVILFRRRGTLPSPGRVWLGAVAYAASQGLWAVYVFEGGDSYTLFRAAGVGLVFLLAALVTASAAASRRDLVARIDLSRREAAVGLLVAVLFALALVAVPYNVLTVGDAAPDQRTVEVRDYTVFYAEDVRDEYVAAYDLPFADAGNVTTSGVIVTSPERQVWWTQVSRGQLAFAGERRVRVGGVGWRDTVVANRTGWSVFGNRTVYRVDLRHDGTTTFAYASDPSRAQPTIAGRNVTLVATRSGFRVGVSAAGERLATVPVPEGNRTVAAGGLGLRRNGTALFAERNGTSVRVATKEQYRG
jgi:membrane associated rhomboid family serine protease